MFPNKQLTVPMPGIEPESVDMVGEWEWQWDERVDSGTSGDPRAVLAQFLFKKNPAVVGLPPLSFLVGRSF